MFIEDLIAQYNRQKPAHEDILYWTPADISIEHGALCLTCSAILFLTPGRFNTLNIQTWPCHEVTGTDLTDYLHTSRVVIHLSRKKIEFDTIHEDGEIFLQNCRIIMQAVENSCEITLPTNTGHARRGGIGAGFSGQRRLRTTMGLLIIVCLLPLLMHVYPKKGRLIPHTASSVPELDTLRKAASNGFTRMRAIMNKNMPPESQIDENSIQTEYLENPFSGLLFIIRGQVSHEQGLNEWKAGDHPIRITGKIYRNDRIIGEETAAAGRFLEEDDLKKMNFGVIRSYLNDPPHADNVKNASFNPSEEPAEKEASEKAKSLTSLSFMVVIPMNPDSKNTDQVTTGAKVTKTDTYTLEITQ